MRDGPAARTDHPEQARPRGTATPAARPGNHDSIGPIGPIGGIAAHYRLARYKLRQGVRYKLRQGVRYTLLQVRYTLRRVQRDCDCFSELQVIRARRAHCSCLQTGCSDAAWISLIARMV